MTKEQCEQQIISKLKEIEKIIQRYNPGNEYMELCIIDGVGSFFNAYWDTDKPVRVNGIAVGKRRNKDDM